MEYTVHVAGALVRTLPEARQAVADAIAAIPHTDVCAIEEPDQLVLVCECASRDEALAIIERVRELPAVVGVSVVYEYDECVDGEEDDPAGATDAAAADVDSQ